MSALGISKASFSAILNAPNRQLPSSSTAKSVHSLRRRPVLNLVADPCDCAARGAFLCSKRLLTRWYYKRDCVSTRDDQVLPYEPVCYTNFPILMFAAAIDAPSEHKLEPRVLRLIRLSLSQQRQGHSLTKLQMFLQPCFLSGYDKSASLTSIETALCSELSVLFLPPAMLHAFERKCPPQVCLGAAIGIGRPESVAWCSSGLFTGLLGFLMLSMGLTLTFEDFKKVALLP